MKIVVACLALLLSTTVMAQSFRTYLSEKPNVSLEKALPVALRAARAQVPNLDRNFELNAVNPRSLKGDKKGQHWEFIWQELPFKVPLRGVAVRVYMKDGSTAVKEFQQ